MKLKFFNPDKSIVKFSRKEKRLMRKAFKVGMNVGIEILNECEGTKSGLMLYRKRFNEFLKQVNSKTL